MKEHVPKDKASIPALPSSYIVNDSLPDHGSARTFLLRNFSNVDGSHSVLNLSLSARIPTAIAPAPSQALCPHWDPSFAANVSSLPPYDDTTPLLLHNVHIVGILTADHRGALHIGLPPHTHLTRIIIAPSPPVSFRNIPVYISDWRHLPRVRPRICPAYLEVLRRDVHPLLPDLTPVSIPSFSLLTASTAFPPQTIVNIAATIGAKSPAVATSNSVSFMLELVSPLTASAVTVFFRPPHISWCPFLHRDASVVITNLHCASLSVLSNQSVLCTTPETQIFPHTRPPDNQPQQNVTPRSRPSSNPRPAKRLRPSLSSGSIVTYEGVVSRCLPPATLQLDEKLLLHLGDFDTTVAGRLPGRAFRPGTRLRASHLVVVARSSFPPRLFATARTSIEILYFADVQRFRPVEWGIQWGRLWRRVNLPIFVGAEEVFDALVHKFRDWFSAKESQGATAGDISLDDSVLAALLGEEGKVGLVQFLMFLLGDGEDVLRSEHLPIRSVHKEFCSPPSYTHEDFVRPSVPTLSRIREAVSTLWLEFVSGQCTNAAASQLGQCGLHAVFSHEEIANMLKGSKKSRRRVPEVAFVALLEGEGRGSSRVRLSDATDVMDVRFIGTIQPSMFGAMVCLRTFSVVVDVRVGSDGETEVDLTILCTVSDIAVVVDGPCVEMERDQGGDATCRMGSRRLGDIKSQQKILRTLTQVPETPVEEADGVVEIADSPLVCIFIDSIVRGKVEFSILGRLISVIESRHDDAWTVLDREGKGFWECELVLRGEAVMKMVTCFEEGRLFGVSCVELDQADDCVDYIMKKIQDCKRQGSILRLTSRLGSMLPWIENLGLGVYMRFVAGKLTSREASQSQGDWLQMRDSEISAEGEKYVHVSKAVEQFKDIDSRDVENCLWRLFELERASTGTSKRMGFCGIVSERVVFMEGRGDRKESKCPVVKLTVMDELFGLFPVNICFYSDFCQVDGIARGMRVCIRRAVQVRMEGNIESFEFIGDCGTTVRLLGFDDSLPKGWVRRCACAQWRENYYEDVTRHVDHVFIDELASIFGPSAGLIQFSEVKVEWVRLRLLPAGTGCDKCGVAVNNSGHSKGTAGSEVEVDMVMSVDDGSREGLFICDGFEICMRMIAATGKERDAVKEIAKACGELEVNMNRGEWAFKTQVGQKARDFAATVWKLFMHGRGDGGVALVLRRAAVPRFSNRLEVRTFKFGFGRSLPIACLPPECRPKLTCLALFNNSSRMYRSVMEHETADCNDSDNSGDSTKVSTVTVVRNMLSKIDLT